MSEQYRKIKLGCYLTNISMSVVTNLSPILFITFNSKYGISFSLLGLLVLINFFTQLSVDLIFSFFSRKFNIPKTVKTTPVITLLGLLFYAVWPYFFPNYIYLGLVIGTVIFSAAAGLSEVLISPVIHAIPSKNPEREMSKLHSVYAWGVVIVVIFSSVFLHIFGNENWQILTFTFTLIPLLAIIFFSSSKFPVIQNTKQTSISNGCFKDKDLWLSVIAIFLGGAAECTMAQWCSGYLESGIGIPKIWGDIFGVALFSLMLGLGRTLYAKYGKNVAKILLLGSIGATLCYFISALSSNSFIGLLACVFTGLSVSMLWPGTLIIAAERFPKAGIFIFAIMAAGGDLGASVGPQLVGIIADLPAKIPKLTEFALSLGIEPLELGLRLGICIAALFPLLAVFIYLKILKSASFKNLSEQHRD